MYLSDPMPQVAEAPESPEKAEPQQTPDANDGEAMKAKTDQDSEPQTTEKPKAETAAEEAPEQPPDAVAQRPEDETAQDESDKLVADASPDPELQDSAKEDTIEPEEAPLSTTESETTEEPEAPGEQTETDTAKSEAAPAPEASEKKSDAATEVAEASVGGKTEADSMEPKAAATTTRSANENKSKPKETVQQAALPRVVAPDHNSLPLWQRNRQRIDRRWLKDSAGNPKPRVAFILSELGLAPKAAEEIIKKLPPAITLSFSPYAKPQTLEYLSALARSNGHEVMLDLPLEPIDFPQRDPGPKALLTALEPKENLERFNWSLGRSTGYVGVAVWMGSRFVGSPRQMQPLMEAIEERGLLYLDNAEREDSLGPGLATDLGIPAVTSHRYVDVPLASRDAIDARLAQVERIALQFGSAVAMGRPFPVTVERLAEWSAELEKRGIILVPITVLAEDAVRRQNLAAKPGEKKSNTKDAQGSGSKTE